MLTAPDYKIFVLITFLDQFKVDFLTTISGEIYSCRSLLIFLTNICETNIFSVNVEVLCGDSFEIEFNF